jgi:hypothetical protein
MVEEVDAGIFRYDFGALHFVLYIYYTNADIIDACELTEEFLLYHRFIVS